MLKLIKAIAWIKGNAAIAIGLIAVVPLIIGIIQTNRANHWEREHLRLESKLEEQNKNQNLFYGKREKERAVRRLEKIEEKKERNRLKEVIREEKMKSAEAYLALEREKEKTATLPPTEIVTQINERIGNESELTGFSLFPFRFTRIGANRILDRFKDGEFYLSEYSKFESVRDDYEAKNLSLAKSLANCEKDESGNFTGWEDCRETLATALDDIEALKKVKSAVIWKGRFQGVVAGGIITIVAGKLLGVF